MTVILWFFVHTKPVKFNVKFTVNINLAFLSLIYDLFTAVKDGSPSLIFISPEALKHGPWQNYMKTYSEKIFLIVFDEIHALSDW